MIRKPDFAKKLRKQGEISNAATAQLISNFVFATLVVQSLLVLNPKCHASTKPTGCYVSDWSESPRLLLFSFFLSFFLSFLLGSVSLFELYDLSMTN